MIRNYNEAYVATVQGDMQELSKRLKVDLIEETDDLDSYLALDLTLPNGFVFGLQKYRAEPNNTISIYFRSQLQNWREILDEIFTYLKIKDESVLDINHDYYRTP